MSFAQYAEVEAGTVLGDQKRGHPRLVEADAHPVTGGPRLGDFEFSLADAVPVADADLVVRQSVDGEVLAEHAPGQIRAIEKVPPELVGVGLIDHHCPLLAAVPAQIALPVTVDIQPSGHDLTGNR